MPHPSLEKLKALVEELLRSRGDSAPLTSTDSLLVTGRLDSLAATELIMALEREFGIDLLDSGLDLAVLDTLEGMAMLLAEPA